MDKFVKKRKRNVDEETQDMGQSVEAATTIRDAASSKLSRNDGINLQLKVRQYCENYIALGFTWTGNPECPSPLCIVCGEKLANSAMAPAKLKRHLITKHPELSSKDEQYFKREMKYNKRQAFMFAKKFKESDKGQEASYAVAEIVARKMKSHTIAESVILPACQEIVRIMFGEDAVSEVKKIPLSDNTISRRIQDLSGDIECNLKSEILKHNLFTLQVDESTDISGKAQLLVFVRFINDEAIVEDFLCCKELSGTTKGQDVFDVLNSYLEYCGLNWKNCAGICTDGAPAMKGCLKGFVPIAQKQNPNIIHTHCFIHREALVAKTVGSELKSVLDMVVKIVNYIKMRPLKCRQFAKLCVGMEAEHSTLIQHTEIRWLSRGRVLSRFYELKEELLIFCLQENLKDFVECLSNGHWCLKLAYLADIFHELNLLNNSMQGRNENILSSTDKMNAFQKKLTIWKKRIAAGNLQMFPCVFKRNCQEIAPLILNHLDSLLTSLDKYFPSLSVDQYDWIRNPYVEFESSEEQFTLREEEELASVLNDRTLKLKYSELNLNAFWILVEKEYPAIAQKALRLLVQFSTSYLCEFGFSALTTIKHKKRAKLLSVEDELRVCLSKTRPNLKELCKKHQAQVSH